MNEEQTLNKMKSSLELTSELESKTTEEKRDFNYVKNKLRMLSQADASLVDLPRVCGELLKFVEQQERQQGLSARLDGFKADMEVLAFQIKETLDETAKLHLKVTKRIAQMDLAEAQHHVMVRRVMESLDELDKVLRRM